MGIQRVEGSLGWRVAPLPSSSPLPSHLYSGSRQRVYGSLWFYYRVERPLLFYSWLYDSRPSP